MIRRAVLAWMFCAVAAVLWPGRPANATVISFCPLSDTMIIGYTCSAWAMFGPPALQVCDECGLCEADEGCMPPDPCNLRPRQVSQLGCSLSGRMLNIEDEPSGSILMVKVQPIWMPNTTLCNPCACWDVWWIPSTDPNYPCVCPNGEC